MAFCNMLDEGSISKIIENDTSITPRLQILNMRKVINAISGERFRLVLSDGQFYVQGVLDKQLNELVENGKLKKYAIIHLKQFICSNISGKMVCLVKECSTIQQCDQGIGKPNAAPSPNQHQSRVCHIYKYIEPTIHKHKTYEQAIQQKNVQKAQPDFQPVASLNPYQTLWKIRVRCTAKDNIRTYSNQRGDGKFFGVDLLDSDGTEIRALAFNDAADKFFNIFKKNYVYLISDAVVRASRKGYTHIKNDYAITLNEDSQVIPYIDDNNEIETQKYTFVQIEQIQKCEPKSFVDVIGIVIHVSDVQTFMSKSHKQIKKRNLKIADQTAKICVTLWNEDAEHHSQEQLKDSVIALKGSRVSVYGGMFYILSESLHSIGYKIIYFIFCFVL